MQDCTVARLNSDRLRQINAIQIEGNAAVSNGLRKITDVKEEFQKLIFKDTVSPAFKLCDDWVTRLEGAARGESS